MEVVTTTLFARPYVFAFLFAYLFLARRLWGWPRTLVWLISGYAIAWGSEYSSIHNGFPYGEYHYIYTSMPGELIVAGVPFFDSLSYPFLIFAGYTMARERMFLGAFFTMLLDVMIDPVATMGDRWFLGKIHWYVHPGWYFGVPFTNFVGWFLIPLAVIACNVMVRKFLLVKISTGRCESPSSIPPRRDAQRVEQTGLSTLFYISIALFNIAIAFGIGEWKLGFASCGILFTVSLQTGVHRDNRKSSG